MINNSCFKEVYLDLKFALDLKDVRLSYDVTMVTSAHPYNWLIIFGGPAKTPYLPMSIFIHHSDFKKKKDKHNVRFDHYIG